MNGHREALTGRARAGTDRTPRRSGDLVIPYFTPRRQDLSILLDQATVLIEQFEAEAWRAWRLAAKHRGIKKELEQLAEDDR